MTLNKKVRRAARRRQNRAPKCRQSKREYGSLQSNIIGKCSNGVQVARRIVDTLGGNWRRDHGAAHCPAHDDRKPSLSVTAKNGRLLVHCHAGCSQEAVMGALRERGVWTDVEGSGQKDRPLNKLIDGMEERRRYERSYRIVRAAASEGQNVTASRRLKRYFNGRGLSRVPASAMHLSPERARDAGLAKRPAMVFAVGDADGRLRGCHVTYLTVDGRKKAAIDVPRRFYGPVRGGYIVIRDLDPDQPLVVAEGVETACAAAEIADLPAVAAGSASNMGDLSLPPCSKVIIAADNDLTGQGAAEQLAQRLTGRGVIVRIALPPKEGEDWNDVLRTAQDPAALKSAIRGAFIWKQPNSLPTLTVSELIKRKLSPRRYLLEPWLLAKCLAMVYSPRGQGKTFLMLSVADAVATGRPLLCWTVEKRARVLYVDGELPLEELQKRVRLLGTTGTNLHFITPDNMYDYGQPMPDLADKTGRALLNEAIESKDIGLVILDSLSTLVRSGTENEAESWAPIQEWALGHRSSGRSIIFVHHSGRSGQPRGTSKREDVLDTVIRLKERKDIAGDQESALECHYEKNRGFYGRDARPFLARLSTSSGRVEWSREPLCETRYDRVVDMIRQGVRQVDIANELDITRGRVSQIVKKAQERGEL